MSEVNTNQGDGKKKPLIYRFTSSYTFLTFLLILPITATIIYIGFRGDLDKCNVIFKIWMLLFIIIGFILIMSAIAEKYHNECRYTIVGICSIIMIILLWALGFVLLFDFNKKGVCKKASPHVYNFVLSIVLIPSIITVILILILIYVNIIVCIYNE
uniref:Transmembrane protein n=1 Tax=Pithovirus LCPAC401 TaxID=2506595 RepID=A0A481ZAQ9_9VIRU|nr:MAG: hypothetical protein LCPAC401_01930 [Pithovirus LCPAC401]